MANKKYEIGDNLMFLLLVIITCVSITVWNILSK
jgi:hypothetical protein